VVTGEAGPDAGRVFSHYLSLTVIAMACGAFCLLQRWERPLGSVAFTGALPGGSQPLTGPYLSGYNRPSRKRLRTTLDC
jgi:hypothetical protein